MEEVWAADVDSGVGKIPWRKKWQPTRVFLPGESHGQRSLAGHSPSGGRESDTTERLTIFTFTVSCARKIGKKTHDWGLRLRLSEAKHKNRNQQSKIGVNEVGGKIGKNQSARQYAYVGNAQQCGWSQEAGSVRFSRSVVSYSLQPHELQHARPPCHQLPEFTQTHVHGVGDAIQPSHL